jgi:hypothetical protein
MKALFGVVSLLLALAVIGVLASRQLRATATAPGPAAVPTTPGATVPQQSQQIQEQVRNEVNKALEQGARRNDPEQ